VYTAVLLVLSCICLSLGINYKEGVTFFKMSRKIPIYSVATSEKKVAITFDTNWGKDNTKEILGILEKYNVKATFFIIGKWADEFPDQVKQIYLEGHEIGNHSYIHPDMTLLSTDRIKNEIRTTDEKIFEITGQTSKIFRCPEGNYNDLVLKTIEADGKYSIQWDVDSIDIRVKQKNRLF